MGNFFANDPFRRGVLLETASVCKRNMIQLSDFSSVQFKLIKGSHIPTHCLDMSMYSQKSWIEPCLVSVRQLGLILVITMHGKFSQLIFTSFKINKFQQMYIGPFCYWFLLILFSPTKILDINFVCRYGIGMIYYKQEKFNLAEIHYRKALSINPSSSVLYCHVGVVS